MNSSSSIFLVVTFAAVMSAAIGSIVTAVMVETPPQQPSTTQNGLTVDEVEDLLAQQEAALRNSFAEQQRSPEPTGMSEREVLELMDELEEAWMARARSELQTELPEGDLDEAGAQALTALAQQLAEMDDRMAALENRHMSFVEEEEERAEERMRQREEERRQQMMEGMLRAAPAVVPGVTRMITGRLSDELDLEEHQQEQVQETLQENLMRAAEVARENRLEGNLSDDEARQQLEDIFEETNTDMQGILTPEQYERWEEMLEEAPGGDGFPGMPGRNGDDNGSQGF